MRIAVVLPRGTHFGPAGATAIDLCVHDTILHSAFRQSTKVYAQPVDEPFDDVAFQAVMPKGKNHKLIAKSFVDAVYADQPDVIIVHQHMPIAREIAKLAPTTPVVLYKHAFAKADGFIQQFRHNRDYNRFAATIWVSHTARNDFAMKYPKHAEHAFVACNGLNLSNWNPSESREKTVVIVGRAVPEKGILEAAKGVVAALAGQPAWTAQFILSRHDNNTAYLNEVRNVLATLGDQAVIELDQPHLSVKKALEAAAIAVVPSTGVESFGRTALEAMAGGAALISSSLGGLREVVASHALVLDPVSPATIEQALKLLITDPELRTKNAEAGRVIAKTRYDISKTALDIDALCLRLCEGKP